MRGQQPRPPLKEHRARRTVIPGLCVHHFVVGQLLTPVASAVERGDLREGSALLENVDEKINMVLLRRIKLCTAWSSKGG